MKNISFLQIFYALLLLIALIVIVQNWVTVKVKFLMFAVEMPMVILLILVFAAGYFSSQLLRRKPE